MDDLISVIVPVYNVETYLTDCLESIISQTYRNLEIILVDDGSTDDSHSILQKYADKDNRIKLIRIDNCGQSKARNLGLNIATGKYILFVDSDDVIGKNHVNSMYIAVKETKADIVICRLTKSNQELNNSIESDYQCISGAYMELLNKMNSMNYPIMAAYCKLYNRDILGDTRFYEGIIYEDGLFFHEMMNNVNTIAVVCDYSYYYRTAPNSTLTKKISIKNFDALKKNELLYSFFIKNHPEGMEYFYKNAMNLNDFIAVKCYEEKTDISKKLMIKLLEQNRFFSENFIVRKQIYKTITSYKLFLVLASKVFTQRKFGQQSFLKNIVRKISK